MPQIQNLVVNDRAATPVPHTFVPRDIIGGVATVVESTGTPIGDKVMTLSLKKTDQGRYKAVLKGRFPVVQDQTVNGVTSPVVVRTAYGEVSFSFEATSTLQERKDVVGMIANALAANATLVNDTVTKLEGVY